jgi:glycosidase
MVIRILRMLMKGYWITDFLDTNEHFGTQADLIQLAQELHKRDMVLLDAFH